MLVTERDMQDGRYSRSRTQCNRLMDMGYFGPTTG